MEYRINQFRNACKLFWAPTRLFPRLLFPIFFPHRIWSATRPLLSSLGAPAAIAYFFFLLCLVIATLLSAVLSRYSHIHTFLTFILRISSVGRATVPSHPGELAFARLIGLASRMRVFDRLFQR